MNKEKWLGIARHVLGFVGAYAVSRGWADDSTIAEIIGGLIALGSVVWSVAAPEKQ